MQLRLIVINKASGESTPYNLTLDEKITIGRHLGSPIILQSEGISRYHFSIAVLGESLFVEDLSSNGTSLNGVFMQPEAAILIKEGDTLDIPGYEFRIVEAPQPEKGVRLARELEAKPKPAWTLLLHVVSELLEPLELILVTLLVAVGVLIAFVLTG
jgi:pSer/pThr/pTyr-binding forkhead associated (FHA) protein